MTPTETTPTAWTPKAQLEREQGMTPTMIAQEREALTPEQLTQLAAYEKQEAAAKEKAKTSTPYEQALASLKGKLAIDLAAAKTNTATKQEAAQKETQDKITTINQKISRATPQDQDQLYLEKEQLKEEYQADLRELEQENADELKAIDQAWITDEAQLAAEHAADVVEREQERPEELQKLEEELRPLPTPAKAPLTPAAESLLIHRVDYPRWWKRSAVAKIACTAPGSQTIIGARAGFRTYVSSITFLVSGETIITLGFGVFGSSGPMPFGAGGQPFGITMNMGDSPAPCGYAGLSISASGDPLDPQTVGGYVVYHQEPE